MMDLVAALLPFAQAEAPMPDYSIRYFLAKHRRAFKHAADWIVQNGSDLFSGAVVFVFTIVFCIALFFFIRQFIVPRMKNKHKSIATGLLDVSGPVVRLVFWFGFSFSVNFIPFSAAVHKTLDKVFYVCFILALLGIFQHGIRSVTNQMLVRFKQNNPENFTMNKLLLDLSVSIIRLAIWLFIIIFILQNVFRFDVTHLLASAGIFGLGVAFAAKDTISNIFGAFAILGGKMFKVGDSIKTGSTEGIVDKIGIRSIRIRAFNDGRLIDIPNHIIADSQIENYSTRLYCREHFSFGLVYQTTPEQMSLAKKILLDIANDLDYLMVKNKPVQFDFALFDQSSLNLDGYVWFKWTDYAGLCRARGLFNEEVLKRFNAAGLDIAFPTTTVILNSQTEK